MRVSDQPEVLPLTGLRFVAALLVFIFHIHMRWPVTENAYLDNFFSGGAIGMTVFFVLSGYILAHTYSRRSFTPWAFYRARFARIYRSTPSRRSSPSPGWFRKSGKRQVRPSARGNSPLWR